MSPKFSTEQKRQSRWADNRKDEALRLIEQLSNHEAEMSKRDLEFYESLLERGVERVSEKQIFWLRDMQDRYVLGV
jgi:hypothetical protein